MSDSDDEVREICPFKVTSMPQSCTCLHIGAPSSGKTFNMAFLSYAQKHIYPVGQAICGSETEQGAFGLFIGNLFTANKFDSEVLEQSNRRQSKAKSSKCPHYHALQYIDDIGFFKKGKHLKDNTVIESIKNGTQWLFRQLHIGIHSAKEVHDELEGFSYIFVYYEKNDQLRRLLWRLYFKAYLPNFPDFVNLMDDMCKNFGVLVIDVKKQSNVLEECVFIHRAPFWKWSNSEDPNKKRPYPEGWRFGCQQFRDWNDARYDKKYKPEYIRNLIG